MSASILRRLLQCILLVLLTSGQSGVDGLDCYVGRDDNYRPLDCSIGVCRIVDCLCAKVVHTDGGVSRNDFHVEAVFVKSSRFVCGFHLPSCALGREPG